MTEDYDDPDQMAERLAGVGIGKKDSSKAAFTGGVKFGSRKARHGKVDRWTLAQAVSLPFTLSFHRFMV